MSSKYSIDPEIYKGFSNRMLDAIPAQGFIDPEIYKGFSNRILVGIPPTFAEAQLNFKKHRALQPRHLRP